VCARARARSKNVFYIDFFLMKKILCVELEREKWKKYYIELKIEENQ
jgi:hypothetical protein